MAASKSFQISKERLLLVEGRDDEEFLRGLCVHMDVSNLQVHQYGGKTNLRPFLSTLPRLPNFEMLTRLGITRDADDSAADTLKSVQDALANAELPAAEDPGSASHSIPHVSVMLIPPEGSDGCLETLLWETIETSPVAGCIEEFVDCADIPASGSRSAKARVYAYIAAQDSPGLKIGEAARAGYWDFDHAAFNPLKNFVRALAA